jgi:hypothetical protein
MSIIDSTNPFPMKSCLARICASGTPNKMAIRVAISAEYTLTKIDEITWLSCRFAIIEFKSEDNIRLTIGMRINKTKKDPIKAKKIVV